MCGRFALDDKVNASITEFVERTGRRPDDWNPDWESQYNIKPTQDIAVLIDSAKTGELRFERARWSLVPPWSDSLKLPYPTFNARSEGAASKATWRGPVKSSRAIVFASGYYEWTGEKGARQPHYIRYPNDSLIGFAGLYSWWADRSLPDDAPGRWTLTATILTAATVPELAHIHDRVPVLLPQDLWLHWVDPSVTGDQALVDEAVAAGHAEASTLVAHEVAPFTLGDNGPGLIKKT